MHTTMKLICFPYAGGSERIFERWPELLPSAISIFPVLLPGRGKRVREPLVTSLKLLVDEIVEVLARINSGPYAMFGHSLGAMLAFELARELRRRGLASPEKIIVAARRAPQILVDEVSAHKLSDPEFIDRLRTMEGTSEEMLNDTGTMEFFLPLLRADFKVADTYVYQPELPFSFPISVYGAMGDKGVAQDELKAWEVQTNGTFNIRMFSGNHFFLNDPASGIFSALARDLLL